MVRMRYAVSLTYEVHDPTADFIFNFHAAQTARQTVVTESLQLTPALPVEPHTEPTLLNRRLRVRAPKGHFSVSYAATVDIDHLLTAPEQLFEVPIADLPLDVITYLAPSRYCESDRLMEFALREFGGYQRGYPLVITIRDWVCSYVRFAPQSTNERTSAVSTLVERKGVCRDYAHLMIALCRALSIPARFSSSLDYGADPLLGPRTSTRLWRCFWGSDGIWSIHRMPRCPWDSCESVQGVMRRMSPLPWSSATSNRRDRWWKFRPWQATPRDSACRWTPHGGSARGEGGDRDSPLVRCRRLIFNTEDDVYRCPPCQLANQMRPTS